MSVCHMPENSNIGTPNARIQTTAPKSQTRWIICSRKSPSAIVTFSVYVRSYHAQKPCQNRIRCYIPVAESASFLIRRMANESAYAAPKKRRPVKHGEASGCTPGAQLTDTPPKSIHL